MTTRDDVWSHLRVYDHATMLALRARMPERERSIVDVATQEANFPADLQIEQWIHDRYPGLRPLQERSPLREVARCEPLFYPLVQVLAREPFEQAALSHGTIPARGGCRRRWRLVRTTAPKG